MTSDQRPVEPIPRALPEVPNWVCLCFLAGFVLALLGGVLLGNSGDLFSNGRMDLARYFVHWRFFGFSELREGRLALWNPHYYCGAPFFGNFQSALLYPLNFLYLIAPLAVAINWTIALHVFLGGVFTFYWARRRGLHSLACLLAGMMFMFCGPHFLQIHAGHLPNLCTLIWAPLLFLAIDEMIDRPGLAPCLGGMVVLAMAILAGHAQYVFYMGVAGGIYACLNLTRAQRRGKAALGFGGIVLGGIGLSAIQLFTGIDEGRESIRSLGTPFEFASSFSFPPENLLTLVAPWCFGDARNIPYFGRWFVTEVSLFVSVIGLMLAVWGMAAGARPMRRFSTVMLAATLLLALGGYTPLFHFLYNYVPGFNLFRGMDKFLWLSALFLSMLAAVGLDQLLRGGQVRRWLIGVAVGLALVATGLSFLPHHLDWWSGVLAKLSEHQLRFTMADFNRGPLFPRQSSEQCAKSLLEGAAALLVAAALLLLTRIHRSLACAGILLMAVVELSCFARTSLMTMPLFLGYPRDIAAGLAANPGDYRVKCENPNTAMSAGTFDIDGDDPSGLLRYVRYYNFTRGIDFDTASPGQPPIKTDAAGWRMLRCRYVISESRGTHSVLKGDLPRLLLVNHYRLMTDYHQIFTALANTNFNIDKEIILEKPPMPEPSAIATTGSVALRDSSTDAATIEADVPAPCLLLMTDAYSVGWRALALPGSSQDRYEILPANYCLRAIPLAAGHHLFRVEYSPLGFRVGRVVSIVSCLLFTLGLGLHWRGRFVAQQVAV